MERSGLSDITAVKGGERTKVQRTPNDLVIAELTLRAERYGTGNVPTLTREDTGFELPLQTDNTKGLLVLQLSKLGITN